MTVSSKLLARLGLPTVAALVAALPASAFQSSDSSTSFLSAPEIEIALASSALLVAGGAALILRDRKARRQNNKPQ
jgi:hypothetical protein